MTLAEIAYNATANKNGTGLKQRVFICKADDYPGAGETATDNLITAIASGPEFVEWIATRPSVKFTVTTEGEADAKSFNVEGEFFIPGITPAKSKQLSESCNYPMTLIAEDRNDNFRRVGMKHDGVMLSVTEETEARNGYLVTYSITGLPSPPAFVQDETVVPVPA
tara:strand:- start:861 stop:1358 length:498 start_codon:yes stop_codon:yes gene_type:complete